MLLPQHARYLNPTLLEDTARLEEIRRQLHAGDVVVRATALPSPKTP